LEKAHLDIMMSDFGYISLKSLVVLCTAEEPENRALRWKMLIGSRKRFLEAHRKQLDELPFSLFSDDCLEGC
jgi:hypothetical protein